MGYPHRWGQYPGKAEGSKGRIATGKQERLNYYRNPFYKVAWRLYKGKMKQILKKILPKAALQQAVILRDQIKLNMAPSQTFEEGALKPLIKTETLKDFFSSSEREQAWNAALQRITDIYGRNTAMGGVNPGDRRALFYLVHALKPQNLLEIGTHIGASTVFLAEALKNVSAQARMTPVDILEVSPSSEFLANTQEKFDFIFLDGDHSSHTVYEEVSLALKALNQNGIILLHDYYPAAKPLFNDGNIIAGPFMALDRIMRENKEIKVLPLGDLPWETKQGLRKTSLALLTRAQ